MRQSNPTDVNTGSGTTIVFSTPPINGSTIDVVGVVPLNYTITNTSAQYTWTNTHSFTNAITANVITVANGLYSVGPFNGTYTDGIVTDYVTGNGRISVGPVDNLTFYTGGVAANQTMTINASGTFVNGSFNTSTNTANIGTALYVTSTGNIGVNNSSPSRRIHALGSATSNSSNEISIWGYQAAFEVMNQAYNQNWYFGVNDADTSKLYIGRGYSAGQGVTPSMVIDTSDNVGIGVTAPAGKLDVANRGITKGSMPAGSILQVVQTVISSTATINTNTTAAAVSGFAATITPTSSTSKIWILCEISYGTAGGVTTYGGYFQRNGTTIGVGQAGSGQQQIGFGLDYTGDGNQVRSIIYSYLDSPASTSAQTYQMWVNNDNNNTLYLNRSASDSAGATGKRGITTITLFEVAA